MSIQSTIDGLKKLGNRLKAERKRLGWSRKRMADNGLVSNASQRKYEDNETIPPLVYLLNLTMAGADLNYLLHSERAQSNRTDILSVSSKSIDTIFRTTWQLANENDNRISSVDDASELFLALLKQVHMANDLGIDPVALSRATARDSQDQT